MSPMRRLFLILLAATLALPALAVGARLAQGDGSLSVARANGIIVVEGKGLIYGHFDRGTLTLLEDYHPDDLRMPAVSGAKMKLVGDAARVVYSGTEVRFLFPSGRYALRFDGDDIDISAVGTGTVKFLGREPQEKGTYSVNGGRPLPLTNVPSSVSYGGSGSTSAATAPRGKSKE
jgi:hypothetical protein